MFSITIRIPVFVDALMFLLSWDASDNTGNPSPACVLMVIPQFDTCR